MIMNSVNSIIVSNSVLSCNLEVLSTQNQCFFADEFEVTKKYDVLKII